MFAASHKKTPKSEAGRREDYAMIRAAQDGDVASRNQVVMKYTAWIKRQTLFFEAWFIKHDFDDIQNIIVIAMIEAVGTFDLSSGHAFISHAKWTVRQAITSAGLSDSIIRIPRKWQQRRDERMSILRNTWSLNSRLADDGQEFGDTLSYKPEDLVAAQNMADPVAVVQMVRHAVSQLPDMLETVLTLRLDGVSHLAIARRFGITQRRVQTLEAKAKRQLKAMLANTHVE